MENSSLYTGAALLVGVVVVYEVLIGLSTRKLDPREPAVLRSSIPWIGHILGMVIHGGRYTKIVGTRRKLPIFTLPTLNTRTYVVTDATLAAAVQRSKSLSFTPLIPILTQRVLGLDDETIEIVKKNLNREDGPGGYIPAIHDLVYSSMSPGESLNELSLSASTQLAVELQKQLQEAAKSKDGVVVDLLHWVQQVVTFSTGQFVFGPKNPIAVDPTLAQSFWDFDHNLGGLLVNVMPSITARKAYRGRERLVKAFEEYLENGHHLSASKIVQERIEIANRTGWRQAQIAREELSFLFAAIVNTTTTCFWVLLHIYARPELLREIREEVESNAVTRDDISIERLRNHCPLLHAVYREALRLGSDNFSTRLVLQDTVLADQHFLKAGSVVQISGGIMHGAKDIWGEDADDFNPSRFLALSNGSKSTAPDKPQTTSKPKQIHPAAFRAFGGGATLCPGRHFATNEILSFAALVVLQFDISSPTSEPLSIPPKKDNVLPVHILEPTTDVVVRLKPRSPILAPRFNVLL